MDDDEAPCETARLAQMVGSPEWLRDSVVSSEWACPTCRRLAEVVLPMLQVVERRLRHLEHGGSIHAPSEAALTNQFNRTERDTVVSALQRTKGIQKDAAILLGVTERVIGYKVKKYDLHAYCAMPKRRIKETT